MPSMSARENATRLCVGWLALYSRFYRQLVYRYILLWTNELREKRPTLSLEFSFFEVEYSLSNEVGAGFSNKTIVRWTGIRYSLLLFGYLWGKSDLLPLYSSSVVPVFLQETFHVLKISTRPALQIISFDKKQPKNKIAVKLVQFWK